MKTFSKLLVASALVASYTAPAFARDVQFEGLTLMERNTYTNPQPAKNWSNAYAMEASMKWHNASAAHWDRTGNSGKDLGAASIQ